MYSLEQPPAPGSPPLIPNHHVKTLSPLPTSLSSMLHTKRQNYDFSAPRTPFSFVTNQAWILASSLKLSPVIFAQFLPALPVPPSQASMLTRLLLRNC